MNENNNVGTVENVENVKPVETVGNATPTEALDIAPEFDYSWSTAKKVEYLQKWQGAKVIKNVTLQEVTATKENNRVSIVCHTDKNIPAYAEVAGVQKLLQTHTLYTSNIEVRAHLRNIEMVAKYLKYIDAHPVRYEDVLSYANVDVLLLVVPAGVGYINPFTTRMDVEPTMFKNNKMVPYIIAINGFGKEIKDELRDIKNDMREERRKQEEEQSTEIDF